MEAFNPETEVICDYEVTSKMKGLWNVEAEILCKFREVCEKYDLSWFAIGGTLLGAVRHKGFIPWDDDMDVAMPQKDYERLCEIGEKEFTYPYFFQLYTTDPYAAPWHVKIRRSDTTGCSIYENEHMPDGFNKGIFFDVFPLFDVPDNEKQRNKVIKKINYWKKKIGFKRGREGNAKHLSKPQKAGLKAWLHELIFVKAIDYNKLCSWYMKFCSKHYDSQTVGLISIFPENKTLQWNREWFTESVELPFGNITVRAPKEYDKVLTVEYGDYMTPVKGTQLHTALIVDATTPYSEYFKKENSDTTAE